MTRSKKVALGTGLVVAIGALGVTQATLGAADRQLPRAPKFEVDPMWPRPMPNHWILGSVIGVGVDSRNHVFIIHRGDSTLNQRTEAGMNAKPPIAECCQAAPPIVEFDPDGNMVRAWGGPGEGYTWPSSNHGITIDDKDNVWIGGNGGRDSHILKFSHDGKFIAQFGTPGQAANSNDSTHFGRVAKISFDTKAQEAYVSDGYGNKRVAVLDMNSGKLKRFWGAYGNRPDDANLGPDNPDAPLAKQFRNPVHCAEPTNDGLVYVCDRPNDRIQVFKTSGEFVKEVRVAPATRGDGSVWDIAFSRDAAQKYLYLADGKNEKVYIMDRQSLEILTSFGDGGRQPGQFFAVHSIATDSRGNIYTTETYEGKRLQKFTYRGLAPVTKANQGVVWPARPAARR
ncbi:MAG: hypothetical protein IT353_10055 [Gemmatimonadaceae bacterium]|nr:hypothetical protein [Gemmatimonadaceae bacterium]